MKNHIKNFIKECFPPKLFKIIQKIRYPYGFYGNFSSWEEARKLSTGYDSEIIANKVKDICLKVKNGEAVYERDSVLFDTIQYSWPVLAGLLWIASQNENKLNLCDFGGSLGSSYYQNIKFLTHLKELKWNIVEQVKFVEYGKIYFENEHIKFYYDFDTCIQEQSPFVILLSGVLQYLSEPYKLLKKVKESEFKYVIFDRTPFLIKDGDCITIQKVPPFIYEASFPAWFFNLQKFLSFFLSEYELIVEFNSFEETIELRNGQSAVSKGFIFSAR